jgi:RNA polymerase sigma-54 factor
MKPPGSRTVGPRLDLRQAQGLVMTPQLQQAIKLLQLSNVEVTEFVAAELERNPLLEREEHEDGERHGEPVADTAPAETIVDPIERDATGEHREEAPLDADFSNHWDDDIGGDSTRWREAGRGGDFDDDDAGLEGAAARAKTLREHLLEQVATEFTDPVDRIVGAHLVHQLDEAGYLAIDLGSVAEQLRCEIRRIEETLTRLQHFDPPGVFARDLKECLSIQLRDKNRLDPAMQALLDHLHLLAKRDVGSLMKICGVDASDLSEMVAEIKALDPKPGLAFDSTTAQPVIPDVLMRPSAGGWIVELNQETLPRVLVNQRYYARVVGQTRNRGEKDFLVEQLQAANWLVKSLHQRAQTILKVATEIVRQQEAFFARGVQHLRPLVLRDIADAIEMHESTVSRVTTNKFIASPHGVFELKYFFTAAIAASEGGDAHSAEAVRHRLRALVAAETPDGILSDDRLVELLKAEGVEIARRTIAKYREALGIPSSVQRRRDRAIGF